MCKLKTEEMKNPSTAPRRACKQGVRGAGAVPRCSPFEPGQALVERAAGQIGARGAGPIPAASAAGGAEAAPSSHIPRDARHQGLYVAMREGVLWGARSLRAASKGVDEVSEWRCQCRRGLLRLLDACGGSSGCGCFAQTKVGPAFSEVCASCAVKCLITVRVP